MLDALEPLVPRGAAFFPLEATPEGRRFAFLLLPQFTLSAFSAALDPLRIANQLSQRPLYRWEVRSEDGGPVVSSCGVSLNVDGALGALARETALLVCSGNLAGQGAGRATIDLLRRHHQHGGTLGGICTGAVTLARAGVLRGRAFTLHWENQPGFAEQFPGLMPSSRRYEIDGRVMTCGGGAAATDLALKIIADDHGAEFAAFVAEMCLRGGSVGGLVGEAGSQRSSLASVLQTRNPWLIGVVKLMHDNLEFPLSRADLARRAGYSDRHIERLFRRAIGTTPGQYYRGIRLDHARSLLAETDMTLFEIAAACGFDSKAYFAKAFKQRFGTPPSRLNYHTSHAGGAMAA